MKNNLLLKKSNLLIVERPYENQYQPQTSNSKSGKAKVLQFQRNSILY